MNRGRDSEEQLARDSYVSAAIAVGGLGTIGLVVAAILATTGWADDSIVETRSMVTTSLVLCCVGYGLWWGGTV